MKKIFFIIVFLSFSFSFSQAEEKAVKNTLKDFKTAYNNSDYDAIFNLFNDKMKAKFPLEKVEKFYGKINKVKGDIKALDFKNLKGSAHIYKAKFKKDVLNMEIDLDEDNLINTLVIKRPKRDYKRN